MRIQRKYGKHEVIIDGTEEQVERHVVKFLEQIKSEEPMVETCNIIRETAKRLEWPDAGHAPILDLTKRISEELSRLGDLED